jgi:hypothetical protein
MKAAALRGALSDRSSHGRVAVVSRFVEGEEPSTSSALTVLRAAVGETGARLSRLVLVVVNDGDELTRKSLRNAVHVRVLTTGQLNTYDVLASDYVVFTHAALSGFTGQEPPADDAPARAKPATKGAARAAPAEDEAAGDAPAKGASVRAKPAAKDRAAKVEAAGDAPAKDAPAKAKPAAKDEAAKDEAAPRRTRTARGSGAAGGDKPDEEQQ